MTPKASYSMLAISAIFETATGRKLTDHRSGECCLKRQSDVTPNCYGPMVMYQSLSAGPAANLNLR